MSWYQAGLLDPVAAIEVETRADSIWDSEVRNLFYSSAGLKVLLTYAREGHQVSLVEGVRNAFRRRRRIGGSDEFLFILMTYEEKGGKRWFIRWEGYTVHSLGNAETQVKRL